MKTESHFVVSDLAYLHGKWLKIVINIFEKWQTSIRPITNTYILIINLLFDKKYGYTPIQVIGIHFWNQFWHPLY